MIKCKLDHKIIKCKVIENMGYQGGDWVKAVEYNGEERIVIKDGNIWREKTVIDKLLPMGRGYTY